MRRYFLERTQMMILRKKLLRRTTTPVLSTIITTTTYGIVLIVSVNMTARYVELVVGVVRVERGERLTELRFGVFIAQ